ncbi:hypothetical protein ACFX13_040750 [Malus domestica]
MSDFPPELLFDILSRLPPKDLIRFLSVSKAWNAIIRHHHFIKAHLQRSIQTNSFRTILVRSIGSPSSDYFSSAVNGSETFRTVVKIERPLKSPERYQILGCSIHGVVCICNSLRTNVALWNPSIQKFKMIPLPAIEQQQPSSDLHISLGFGYDSVYDDFKHLQIAELSKGVFVSSEVSIYSLILNSWKRIKNLPRNDFSTLNVYDTALEFSNGALCWLMPNRLDMYRFIILTLDLATEKYQEFDTPVDKDYSTVMELEVLGGSLCVSVHDWDTGNDVWIMKDFGGPWTLLYSIKKETMTWLLNYCPPLVFAKNGEMVLLKKDEEAFVWFDLKGKIGYQDNICGLPLRFDAKICEGCEGSLCLIDGDPVIGGRQ